MADTSPGKSNGVPPKSSPEEVQVQAVRIQYPAQYTFKIMGASQADFTVHVTQLVAQVVGPIAAEKVTTRSSPEGKYQSVSVSVQLTSEEQRRAVYQALWEDKRVLYYL